ncbi:MAG: hypothetical protein OXF60_02430 [Gammaproteobacteria bacterium]|nr:hypothetical protein [Gammaproteobacteria bacterium]MCY4218256.1 hypothetical protein [Gammaproteobacteria bacterium]
MKTQNQTRSILIRMPIFLAILASICFWQRDILYQIYVANQVNAVGMVVNAGIFFLFIGGLIQLASRFFEYHAQEQDIWLFEDNVRLGKDALMGIRNDSMVATRYNILNRSDADGVQIDQSALAATLLAEQSSRNSFLKFVHNVLILTGVFGTIISLSLSLIGASELLQIDSTVGNVVERSAAQESSLGVMIYGMSTALSTTLTAIVAYLFFGYFFIKLTDIQTYLVSKLEQVTAIIMVPQFNSNKVPNHQLVGDLSLLNELDASTKQHQDATMKLNTTVEELSRLISNIETDQQLSEHLVTLQKFIQINSHHVEQNSERLDKVIDLLQEGFRIGSRYHNSND